MIERPLQPTALDDLLCEASAASRPSLDDAWVRVFVVDDHPAVRAGVRALIDDQPDLVVVGEACSAEHAMAAAVHAAIDVAVIDYQLGSRSGLWVSRRLKRLPDPPHTLIYSAYADDVLAAGCIVAQADGLVSKGTLGDQLCATIRAAARGNARLPEISPAVGSVIRDQLDHHEQAIFGMLRAGVAPREIAGTLKISDTELDGLMWTMISKLEQLSSRPPSRRRLALQFGTSATRRAEVTA